MYCLWVYLNENGSFRGGICAEVIPLLRRTDPRVCRIVIIGIIDAAREAIDLINPGVEAFHVSPVLVIHSVSRMHKSCDEFM